MSGWIKAHRSLCDWEWYRDGNTFRVFMHLLLKANYAPSRYMGYEVPTGSIVTGRVALAEYLGISERSIRTALEHLKTSGEVTIKPCSKFSIITITNWLDYQQDDQQPTSNRPATDQQPTTSKEVKKVRRYNNPLPPNPLFENFWANWNPFEMDKGTKQTAQIKYEEACEQVSHDVLLAKAAGYCAACAKTKTKTKHVATWLNQRGWESEYSPPPLDVPDWIKAQR